MTTPLAWQYRMEVNVKCADCGGLVTWRGPLSDLTHTECERCGARNSQEPEWPEPDGSEADCFNPAPAAPIGARDPVGFAQHLLAAHGVTGTDHQTFCKDTPP